MTLAQLEADLRRLRECGCTRVEVVVLDRTDPRVFNVVAVDRPDYSAERGVVVLSIAPASHE